MLPYRIVYTSEGKVDYLETTLSGKTLLNIPKLNKGDAFTRQERCELDLEGTLPYQVETLEQQVARCYLQFQRIGSHLDRNIYLNSLHDINEILFFKLISEHLAEMMPIIYTPTIGQAVETFSFENRKHRGLFISYPEIDQIDKILDNRNNRHVDLIVVTDGEGVLGIGDQGVGGIHICVGKLNLYTLCGGIDPNRVLPIQLDVGTNNPRLLNDPLYLGWRHERIAGAPYDEFIAKFIAAIKRKFPRVFLHWEDLGRDNGRRVLLRYRDELCTFNDDIQGTGAVTVAAILAAIKVTRTKLSDQRIVIFGAGSAGVGIADQLFAALCYEGLDARAAVDKIFLIDRPGLLKSNTPDLVDFQKPYAKDANRYHDVNTLLDVIQRVQPTLLIGCAAVAGAFTQTVVESMARSVKHPIIFPLSNPTERVEATPEQLVSWTEGRALIATGTPFAPVNFRGKTITIAQCNNAFVYPGIGLGVLLSQASRLTESMITVACRALSEQSPALKDPNDTLLPRVENILAVSRHIALAVAEQARAEGVATVGTAVDFSAALARQLWVPTYYPYKKIGAIHE